jgi:N-acetylmuramoyl-L-alanine amidase
MVGSLDGTDSYFRVGGYSGTESHFGVGGDGKVYQWQDTEYQADAQLEGNDDGISIETADRGYPFLSWSGSDVPPWTTSQLDAIVGICAWACKTYDIPPVLIPDTLDSTKGIGYHRQGIDPYHTRGEEYSTSYGKVCPGDRRVRQIKEIIIPRVARALNAPAAEGDDEMDSKQAKQLAEIHSFTRWLFTVTKGPMDGHAGIWPTVKGIESRVIGLQARDPDADLDEAALAASLAPLLAQHLPGVAADLDDATIRAIATAAADELARRAVA